MSQSVRPECLIIFQYLAIYNIENLLIEQTGNQSI